MCGSDTTVHNRGEELVHRTAQRARVLFFYLFFILSLAIPTVWGTSQARD